MFWFLKEVEKQTEKIDHVSNWCHDETNLNPVHSLPYSLVLTQQQQEINILICIIKLVSIPTTRSKCHASVTSSFSETKVSFVFVQQHVSIGCPWKTDFFCIIYVISQKTKCKSTKNNNGSMLFMSKQVSVL